MKVEARSDPGWVAAPPVLRPERAAPARRKSAGRGGGGLGLRRCFWRGGWGVREGGQKRPSSQVPLQKQLPKKEWPCGGAHAGRGCGCWRVAGCQGGAGAGFAGQARRRWGPCAVGESGRGGRLFAGWARGRQWFGMAGQAQSAAGAGVAWAGGAADGALHWPSVRGAWAGCAGRGLFRCGQARRLRARSCPGRSATSRWRLPP